MLPCSANFSPTSMSLTTCSCAVSVSLIPPNFLYHSWKKQQPSLLPSYGEERERGEGRERRREEEREEEREGRREGLWRKEKRRKYGGRGREGGREGGRREEGGGGRKREGEGEGEGGECFTRCEVIFSQCRELHPRVIQRFMPKIIADIANLNTHSHSIVTLKVNIICLLLKWLCKVCAKPPT